MREAHNAVLELGVGADGALGANNGALNADAIGNPDVVHEHRVGDFDACAYLAATADD